MVEKASRAVVVEFGDYKPSQPQPYKFPSIVTRDNFASVLSTSFKVSGAKDDRQILYFELLNAHTGFDHISTVQNFLRAGGWNTFAPEEQEMFMKDFEGVKVHFNSNKMPNLWGDMHDEPAEVLNKQLNIYFDYEDVVGDLKTTFEAQYGPLTGMTYQEFLVHLNES